MEKVIYYGYSVVMHDKYGETIYTFKDAGKASDMMCELLDAEKLQKKNLKLLKGLKPRRKLSKGFETFK